MGIGSNRCSASHLRWEFSHAPALKKQRTRACVEGKLQREAGKKLLRICIYFVGFCWVLLCQIVKETLKLGELMRAYTDNRVMGFAAEEIEMAGRMLNMVFIGLGLCSCSYWR